MAGEPVTYYSDIRPIMEKKCLTCHSDKNVSFSFENPETSYQFAPAITAAVSEKRMPPWLAEAGHQHYVGDYSLSSGQLELFEKWATANHPKGEPQAAGKVEAVVPDFKAALTLEVQTDFAYLPDQTRKDDYHCFLVDWPYKESKYVTGFQAAPGNLRIAHHMVLFVVPEESAAFLQTLSETESGPGHQCFGGVLPDQLADDDVARERIEAQHPGKWKALANNYYWLAQWAPGTFGFDFPESTGVLVEPGSVLVAQMHYYSAFAPGETDDNTILQFQVSDTVEKPSIIYPMSHNRWLYSKTNGSMQIPPGESRTYETSANFENISKRASRALKIDPEDIASIELHSANLHMHAYGASGRISLQHPSGMKETLLNVPTWDLDWQRDFAFLEAKTIMRDEFEKARLTVECTFENYSEELVLGGYGSYDEMCFNFSYVSIVKKSEPTGGSREGSVGSK